MTKRFLTGALIALALAAGASSAHAVSISGEVFGGMSIPVLQDDSDQGTVFGLRVPVSVAPLLTLEPWFSKSALGDKSQTIAGLPYERDGGDLTAFGLNARLGGVAGPGVSFFPYAGLGTYTLERSGAEDISEMGYDLGLGLTLTPMPKLGIGLRGQLTMVPTGDTSRKYGEVQVGVSYSFLTLP